MSSDDQTPLFDLPEAELPPDPLAGTCFEGRRCLVYVASALTRLMHAPPERARMVESDLDTVTEAIKSLDLDGALDMTIEPYAPIEHSSAHRHVGLTPKDAHVVDVLRTSTEQLLAEPATRRFKLETHTPR